MCECEKLMYIFIIYFDLLNNPTKFQFMYIFIFYFDLLNNSMKFQFDRVQEHQIFD